MKFLITFLLCCTALISRAQLDSCNAFLQGNYVEVGVNWTGAYGSSCDAPAGYHPRGASPIANHPSCATTVHTTSNREIGFVADPDKDGWTVGSPGYYGDYYMPGYPQEGWAMYSSGRQANVFNGPGTNVLGLCDTNVRGSNISYYLSGPTKITIWEGIYDSIQITQATELDTTKTYFTTHVKFKNLASTPRNNVYYMRTVDPDNDEALSFDYTTKNKIETQYPGNVPHISTWGLHYANAYVGLGTADTPARAFILKGGLVPMLRIDSIYNGYDTAHYKYADSNQADVGIGLVFKIDNLAPLDSPVVAFAYMFKRGDADSALASTRSPFPGSSDTTSGIAQTNKNSNSRITVYPNPPKNDITISGLEANDIITVFDMMGRTATAWHASGSGNNNFNISNLPGGMYILRITDKQGNIKSKMPIQKL